MQISRKARSATPAIGASTAKPFISRLPIFNVKILSVSKLLGSL
jgi:hypothetical protein